MIHDEAPRDVLLDTQVLLWVLTNSPRLGEHARDWLQSAHDLYVSSASAWEIGTKHRLGKLDAGPLARGWADVIERYTVRQLPITDEAAFDAGVLDWEHQDPFDRLIVAQAVRNGLTVATADTVILRSERCAVLDATA